MRGIVAAALGHRLSLPLATISAMTHRNPDNLDLSRACWRCQYFGAVVAEAHVSCARLGAALQASPATGCVYWTPGPGDAQPTGWMPDGARITEKRMIWGAPPSKAIPEPEWRSLRPGVPADAAKWDAEQERAAWRATDAVMSRFRGPARPGARTQDQVNQRIWPAARQLPHPGPDDQAADIPG